MLKGPAEKTWGATRQPREQLLGRLLSPPFRMDNTQSQANRKAGATQLLDWLESMPGETWQERWTASRVEDAGEPFQRLAGDGDLRGV